MSSRQTRACSAILGTVMLLAVSELEAATYYVDREHADASDSNPGTEALPFLTVQRGADAAGPGDLVRIKAGTYAPFEVTNSGSPAGGYITFSAAPGHELLAVIDGTGSSLNSGECIWSNGQSYIAIKNLTVTNCGRNGIRIDGSEAISTGFRISGNYVAFTESAGISVRGKALDTAGIAGVRDVIIEYNEVTRTNEPDGHNEAISVGDGLDEFIIRFNHVHDTDQFGIDAKKGASNGQISGNHIHDIERQGIYLDTSTYYVTDVAVYGNRIYRANSGIVMTRENDSSGPARLERIRIQNNLLYDNRKYGVLLYRHVFDKSGLGRFDSIDIVNNTIFRNDRIGINLASSIAPFATNVVVQNNISWANADNDLVNDIGATEVTNLVGVDALFVSETLPDFAVQEGSPAIDAGTASGAPSMDFAGELRPQGDGFDIGALEFVSGSPPPPPSSDTENPPPPPPPSSDTETVIFTTTLDSYLREASPAVANGTHSSINVDGHDRGGEVHGLLRFDVMSQIPAGSTILSAEISLETTGQGAGADFHRMLTAWNEDSTWKSMADGLQADGVEAEVFADLSSGYVNKGSASFDVTPSVQAWVDGVANYGWGLLPHGNDGWDFDSREGAVPPRLTVTYEPPL